MEREWSLEHVGGEVDERSEFVKCSRRESELRFSGKRGVWRESEIDSRVSDRK